MPQCAAFVKAWASFYPALAAEVRIMDPQFVVMVLSNPTGPMALTAQRVWAAQLALLQSAGQVAGEMEAVRIMKGPLAARPEDRTAGQMAV